MRHLLYILFSVAVLLTACNGHYDERRQQLLELQAMNRADSLMTNDSLALALVAYFDRHGTANDRLLAHYLLGRTYADLGQTPQALEAYHDAADQADTTATDCDFAILSRVHAQMAHIFIEHENDSDALREIDITAYYASAAKDTLMQLACIEQKANVYKSLGNYDSVLSIRQQSYTLYNKYGYTQQGAMALGPSIDVLLQQGNFDKA